MALKVEEDNKCSNGDLLTQKVSQKSYQFTSDADSSCSHSSIDCQIVHQIFPLSFLCSPVLMARRHSSKKTLCGFEMPPCRPCEGNRLLLMFGSSCRLYVGSSLTF